MKTIILTWLALAVSHGSWAQCLAPLDAESNFSSNPVNKINGVFKFDYKIESILKYSMGGAPEELKMDYYVNSSDGTILFPSGPTGFFSTNLGMYTSNDGRIDGAIWLPNGQMVTYVFDADNNINRAITRETSQTAGNLDTNDYQNMMQFFSSSEELAEHPDPMPADAQWNGTTQGYKGELVESRTGIKNTWTIYFDANPTPIKTSPIMVGFMVGVLKDARELKCNRLAVYTRVDIGGPDTGEYMQTELISIKPMGITFDATDYKPTTLGGDAGSDMKVEMDYFQGRMVQLLRRKETLEDRRKQCGSDLCRDNIDRELEELQEQEKRLNCEMAVAMGLEDLLEDCN